MFRTSPPLRLLILALLTVLTPGSSALAAEPHWMRVASSHFVVLTDGDTEQGREVALRFEQMRAVFGQLLLRSRVNMPLPTDIIAFKSDEEYAAGAPSPQGKPIVEAGFSIAGEDREFFVLDLAEADSWRAISHEFGRMLLDDNYPPTQPWFDEGFAGYFASLHLDDRQMRTGEDPESRPAVRQSVVGKPSSASNPPQPLVDLLNSSPWMPLAALFAAKPENFAGNNRQTPFQAQAWMVMHYLIDKNKLTETGNYFGLVATNKLPLEEAIQKAYGMSATQLDQAVKDYFHSVAPLLQVPPGKTPTGPTAPTAAPVTSDDIGVSTTEVPEPRARSLLAEMDLRLPEHHDQARAVLETIAGQPASDNAVAHRALGWDHLVKMEFGAATEEFNAAEELESKDVWTRYYMAVTKFRQAQAPGNEIKGLANMMQDLHVFLDKWPECAEAYFMLGWAQRVGGGVHAAMQSVPAAIRLAPRNQRYLLEMARVYGAAKDWDAATVLLQRLTTSSDAQVAAAAHSDLQDLPYLMKYGVAPSRSAATPTGPAAAQPPATEKPASKTASPGTSNADEGDQAAEAPPEPQIDRRPILYLKGKLVSVDCSQPPAAVVTVLSGAKTLKLKTRDYKSMTLVGEDAFSCTWTNRQVAVNYKAGGSADGDLVSLEVR